MWTKCLTLCERTPTTVSNFDANYIVRHYASKPKQPYRTFDFLVKPLAGNAGGLYQGLAYSRLMLAEVHGRSICKASLCTKDLQSILKFKSSAGHPYVRWICWTSVRSNNLQGILRTKDQLDRSQVRYKLTYIHII